MDIDTNLKYVQKARETFNLSPAEVVMVTVINAGLLGDKATLKTRLIGDLQAAIEVELATIPLYLYSYYSINRTKLRLRMIMSPTWYLSSPCANVCANSRSLSLRNSAATFASSAQ